MPVWLEIAPVDAGLQYLTFFPAVALAAIFGGFASGIIATPTGLLLATCLFILPPYYSFSTEGWKNALWSNLVFVMDGFIISIAIEAIHHYRKKYEDSLDELNKQVAERDLVENA